MTGFFFNTVYLLILILASPWILYRYLRYGKNRRGWKQKLFGLVPVRQSDQPCVWFHAVSVGEVNLLAPVINRLQQQRPEIEIVISTTTETGFELATEKYSELTICWFPFDFTWAIKNSLRRIRPDLIVLAELEVWPNFIRTVSSVAAGASCRRATPIAIINGRLSESSFRGYRKFNWLLSISFQRLSLVAAQNETYAQRFIALGCDPNNVITTGSVKYDGVETNRQNEKSQRLKRLANIVTDEKVLLAGSTQFEEDLLAANVYQQLAPTHPELRLILAPRHPARVPQLIRALSELKLNYHRRSELESPQSIDRTRSIPAPILIIDVIGELGAWWGVADMAYVGGSLGSRGGQNMIEPAAYGIPVSFGPHTKNFQTVVEQLLSADAATVIHDSNELEAFVTRTLTDPDWAKQIGNRAQTEMLRHHGASDRTVEHLLQRM